MQPRNIGISTRRKGSENIQSLGTLMIGFDHVIGIMSAGFGGEVFPVDIVPTVRREGGADEPLAALAFKVQHDPQRGDVVFVRVYSGTLKPKDRLFNTTMAASNHATGMATERVNRLLQVSADSVEELDAIEAGHIGAIVGLKTTRSVRRILCGCGWLCGSLWVVVPARRGRC
jgi:hypothetical protein